MADNAINYVDFKWIARHISQYTTSKCNRLSISPDAMINVQVTFAILFVYINLYMTLVVETISQLSA